MKIFGVYSKIKFEQRNLTFLIEGVKTEDEQICNNEITLVEWHKRKDHCKKNVEKALFELEPAINVTIEQIIANLSEESSDSYY